jgi:adenosylmethionine-8-amino-7-oxononanoate aminotransferase
VKEIRQCGMMAGIELIKDKKRGLAYDWEEKIGVRVCRLARDYGVILRPLGPVIVLMPPLGISLKELQFLVQTTGRCIGEAC